MKKQLLLATFLAIAFGLNAQISLVKDINPGPASSDPNNLTVINNELLFTADDGTNGIELWKSNGSSSGTNLLKNIATTIGESSTPVDFYYSSTFNRIFFTLLSGPNASRGEPWITDGTEIGTVQIADINPTNSASSKSFVEFMNTIYFTATNTSNNSEPWSTDGTSAGTSLFKEINPTITSGIKGSDAKNYKVWNGNMYFSAFDGNSNKHELWKSDGTPNGTNLLKNINPVESSDPNDFTVFNNKLYFSASDYYVVTSAFGDGRELWETDGTLAGTVQTFDVNPGTASSIPDNLTVYNNALYFSATNVSLGREIFKLGTNGNVTLLRNINPGNASSTPDNFIVYNNALFFTADDNANGVELWTSTGFNATTLRLKDINLTGDSNPQDFIEYNGKLYFTADDGVNGRELWVTDGTQVGTTMVDDLASGLTASSPSNLTVLGDELFFIADNGSSIGRELFKFRDPTLSINENVLALRNISLFPNPANTNVLVNGLEETSHVVILDITGKKVYDNATYTSEMSIKTEHLESGLYFVNIGNMLGSTSLKLIIK